jgi:nicotinamidase-related amidase
MSFTYTALHAIRGGYDVYGLIEAAGDSTEDAHDIGVKRMIQAGVIPVTLESLVSEWMHDWDNTKSSKLVNEVYSTYVSMIGLR